MSQVKVFETEGGGVTEKAIDGRMDGFNPPHITEARGQKSVVF